MEHRARNKAVSFARGTLALVALTGGTAVMGCVLGPYTGQMLATEPQGASLAFTGRSDMAAPAITGYVLSDGQLGDPHLGPWTNITNIYYVSGPKNDGKDSVNYYEWSFGSKLLNTTEWPRGGLARFKVMGKFNGNTTPTELYVFDNEAVTCLNSPVEMAKPWRQAGIDCRSPYQNSKLITTVSTITTPAAEHTGSIQYLGAGSDHDHVTFPDPPDPLTIRPETTRYYATIHADTQMGSLAAFKSKFGFPTGEIRAIYYNQGDLGLARDMHCKKTTSVPPVTACYVINYGRNTAFNNHDPIFGALDPQIAINQAIAGPGNDANQPIATVAMVYDPSISAASNRTQFVVYDQNDVISDFAALDTLGFGALQDALLGHNFTQSANINVPHNCLACHGASSSFNRATSGSSIVAGAAFLPFDPQSLVFSSQNPAWADTVMLPRIKQLNQLVQGTTTAGSQIDVLLNGMYPNGGPGGAANFDPTYIPPGWQGNASATQLYNEVVKPYCRTCHLTASAPIDWDSYSEFSLNGSIASHVCGQDTYYPMPQAEQTQTRFWKSPARAHLVEALDLSGACAP